MPVRILKFFLVELAISVCFLDISITHHLVCSSARNSLFPRIVISNLRNDEHNPSVTIQMETIEQHFSVGMFIMLYKVVLTTQSVDEILKLNIQMKATEQCFPVTLFIVLYKVVLTFESVDKIL